MTCVRNSSTSMDKGNVFPCHYILDHYVISRMVGGMQGTYVQTVQMWRSRWQLVRIFSSHVLRDSKSFWCQCSLTLSHQEFDGTIFDRKTEFYYFASMNFMEHKRILHSTADVLKSHDLKLLSATDVRLERDVSRKLTCLIAPSGRLKSSKKISIMHDLLKDPPSMVS